jgi:hypothetical protein
MRRRALKCAVAVVLCGLTAGVFPAAQTARRGAASPQEAVAVLKKAIAASDVRAMLPVISAGGLKELAKEVVTGLLMFVALADPDDPFPGGTPPSKAELDKKRKDYRAAIDLATRTLKPHGLSGVIGKPPLSNETQTAIDTAIAKADHFALTSDLLGMLPRLLPLLGGPAEIPLDELVKIGDATDYSITGDTATARDGAATIQFERVGGRWFLTPPAKSSGQPPPGGPADAPLPPAQASGSQPEVVAGGVRVVRVVAPRDDFSARPFGADNGTHLALWIKMPAGQGLIEIDERASVLQHFGDDKGTDLGGRFESFPDEFEDGTGGVFEIESTGRPAAGASALLADGTIVMTIATGTRKTRIDKVRLENGQKVTLGKVPVTVDEVTRQGDSLTFTLKLSRDAMTGIRTVAFFDAKGQPIEGRSSGRGYMNDNAEMNFSVNTTAPIVAIEFDMWEGRRSVKVPFKVKASLGLN